MFSTKICVDRLVLLSRCNFAEKLLTSFSSVKAWRKVVPKHATINNYHAPSWSKKSTIQSWDQKVRCEKIWGNSATKHLQKKLLGVLCINHIHTHADSFAHQGWAQVEWSWCTSKMKPKNSILFNQAMTELCPNSYIHHPHQIHLASWIFLACCFIASTHAKSAAEMIKPLIMCQ